jgi:hypothetical protein
MDLKDPLKNGNKAWMAQQNICSKMKNASKNVTTNLFVSEVFYKKHHFQ